MKSRHLFGLASSFAFAVACAPIAPPLPPQATPQEEASKTQENAAVAPALALDAAGALEGFWVSKNPDGGLVLGFAIDSKGVIRLAPTDLYCDIAAVVVARHPEASAPEVNAEAAPAIFASSPKELEKEFLFRPLFQSERLDEVGMYSLRFLAQEDEETFAGLHHLAFLKFTGSGLGLGLQSSSKVDSFVFSRVSRKEYTLLVVDELERMFGSFVTVFVDAGIKHALEALEQKTVRDLSEAVDKLELHWAPTSEKK